MASAHDDWLRALAAAGKGPVAVPGATRGLAWTARFILEGDDWSTAVLDGTVRIAPDSPTILATFAFSSGAYDAGANETSWDASLLAGTGLNSTGSLPSDTEFDGVTEFPFMVRITPSGGDTDTLCGGLLPVVGKV